MTITEILDLGPHAVFVWASYAVVVGGTVAMIAVIWADERRQARMLAELEARGITRRSARARQAAGSATPSSSE